METSGTAADTKNTVHALTPESSKQVSGALPVRQRFSSSRSDSRYRGNSPASLGCPVSTVDSLLLLLASCVVHSDARCTRLGGGLTSTTFCWCCMCATICFCISSCCTTIFVCETRNPQLQVLGECKIVTIFLSFLQSTVFFDVAPRRASSVPVFESV